MEAVPERLRLVESFLSSIDVETGQDDLTSLASMRRWLGEHGYPGQVAEPDRALAVRLRDQLREVLRGHHDGVPPAGTGLDGLCAPLALRVRYGAGGFRLDGAGTGARGLLTAVLAGVVLAEADGSWRRLKICRNDTCQVVFYDHSKNGSRQWCAMRPCGNRSKARAYRNRHRPG